MHGKKGSLPSIRLPIPKAPRAWTIPRSSMSADCAAGETCRLHIVLHGCKQGREVVGKDFARLTVDNRWAEANRIVVLYPQAEKDPDTVVQLVCRQSERLLGLVGLFGSDYLSRTAPQPSAVARMAAAVGASLDQ